MTHFELLKECSELHEHRQLIKITFCNYFEIDDSLREYLTFQHKHSEDKTFHGEYEYALICIIEPNDFNLVFTMESVFQEIIRNFLRHNSFINVKFIFNTLGNTDTVVTYCGILYNKF